MLILDQFLRFTSLGDILIMFNNLTLDFLANICDVCDDTLSLRVKLCFSTETPYLAIIGALIGGIVLGSGVKIYHTTTKK